MGVRYHVWLPRVNIVVEVTMSDWVARYQEGYITIEGKSVTLVDELHTDHPWHSPSNARAHWANREDLASPEVEFYGNGLEQVHDVRARREFRSLDVAAVWRRVTFQRTNGPRSEPGCSAPN